MQIERPDVGRLVLEHRDAAGLSQVELAARAGVSQASLSAIERNRRDPSLTTLCKVLDALELTLRLDVADKREVLDATLDAALARPLADRLRHGRADGTMILQRLAPAAPVLDGIAGAAAHGAPVTVDHVDVIVAEASVDQLAAGLRSLASDRWSEQWRQFGPADPDPRRPGAMRWLTIAGEVRVRLVAALPAAVTVLLGAQEIAVRPLHEIEAGDAGVARALARLRERAAG